MNEFEVINIRAGCKVNFTSYGKEGIGTIILISRIGRNEYALLKTESGNIQRLPLTQCRLAEVCVLSKYYSVKGCLI